MKELDKSKIYDLSKLTDEQLNELCNKRKELNLSLYFENYGDLIYDVRNTDWKYLSYEKALTGYITKEGYNDTITCATELFEPQYEVKMIVEAPNDFKQITDSIASLLQYKNEKYGNSALDPLNVFQGKCKVGQRLDDKLARVKNNDTLQKNDVADLIGYLFLVCKENEWNNFDEFKD